VETALVASPKLTPTFAYMPAESVEAASQAALSNRRNGHSKKTVRGENWRLFRKLEP
jgi:hypothetical protein